MANIFVQSPTQSSGLVDANILVPSPILNIELVDQNVLETRKRYAATYCEEVATERKRSRNFVTPEDTYQANNYLISAVVASMITDMAGNMNLVALQPVMALLGVINNRLTNIENRLTGVENRLTGVENRLTVMESKSFNATANTDVHDIIPPPNQNNDPIPNNFPRTIAQLRNLNNARLTTMETFYGLPLLENANLSIRRDRIRRTFGITAGVGTSTAILPL